MKTRLAKLLLLAVAVAAPIRATTFWQGDNVYAHFDILSSVDIANGISFEAEGFYLGTPISHVGNGGPDSWSMYKMEEFSFTLIPHAGWEFTSFNGAATDSWQYRNSPVNGAYSLETYIDLNIPGGSWSHNIYNGYWGSGGGGPPSFIPFTPWHQSYAITGPAAHGVELDLRQLLYISNDGFFSEGNIGFDFSMQESPVSTSVPDSGSTLALLVLGFAGVVVTKHRDRRAQTVSGSSKTAGPPAAR